MSLSSDVNFRYQCKSDCDTLQYGKVAMCTYRGHEKRNYKGMGRIEKIATGNKKSK